MTTKTGPDSMCSQVLLCGAGVRKHTALRGLKNKYTFSFSYRVSTPQMLAEGIWGFWSLFFLPLRTFKKGNCKCFCP